MERIIKEEESENNWKEEENRKVKQGMHRRKTEENYARNQKNQITAKIIQTEWNWGR